MAKADAIAAAKERALQAAHDAAVAAQAAEDALAAEIAAESAAEPEPVPESIPEPAPAVKAAEAVQVVMHKTYDIEVDKRQRAQSPANM